MQTTSRGSAILCVALFVLLAACGAQPATLAPTAAAGTATRSSEQTTAPASPAASTTPAAASGSDVRLDEPFTLKLSHWANLLDGSSTRVSFTSVREDTRCPLKPAGPCDGVGRALVALSAALR